MVCTVGPDVGTRTHTRIQIPLPFRPLLSLVGQAACGLVPPSPWYCIRMARKLLVNFGSEAEKPQWLRGAHEGHAHGSEGGVPSEPPRVSEFVRPVRRARAKAIDMGGGESAFADLALQTPLHASLHASGGFFSVEPLEGIEESVSTSGSQLDLESLSRSRSGAAASTSGLEAPDREVLDLPVALAGPVAMASGEGPSGGGGTKADVAG